MRRKVGFLLITAVTLWDVDAMRPHIAAHSWLTLGYVSIFLIGHLIDMVTTFHVGNLAMEIA